MRIFLDKVSPSEFGIFQENFADFLECDDTSSFTNMKGRTLPEHLSELVGNFFGQNDIKIEIGP